MARNGLSRGRGGAVAWWPPCAVSRRPARGLAGGGAGPAGRGVVPGPAAGGDGRGALAGVVLGAVDGGAGLSAPLPGGPLDRLARHPAQRLVGIGDPIAAAV